MNKYSYVKHNGKVKSLVIWGKDGCIYCRRAKELGSRLIKEGIITGLEYSDIGLNKEEWIKVKEELEGINVKVRTVPQCIGLTDSEELVYIGGFNELYTVMGV